MKSRINAGYKTPMILYLGRVKVYLNELLTHSTQISDSLKLNRNPALCRLALNLDY